MVNDAAPRQEPKTAPRDSTAEAPDRSTLLELLDSELTLLSQQQANTGWTSWALVGALGAIGWTLLSIWETPGWPQGVVWVHAYVALVFCRIAVQFLFTMFQGQGAIINSRTRFELGHSTGKRRALQLFSIAHHSLLIFLLFTYAPSPLVKWSALAISVPAVLGFAISFVLSYTEFPITTHAVAPQKLGPALMIPGQLAAGCIALTPAILLCGELSRLAPKAVDLKVGGLLAAAVFLIQQALDARSNRSSIESLLKIRRELALGSMPTTEAARLIEIEFLGMRISDVFRDPSQSFAVEALALAAEFQAATQRVETTLSSIQDGSPLSVEQRMGLATTALEAYQSRILQFPERLKKLKQRYDKIESRMRLFSSTSDATKAALSIQMVLAQSYQHAAARHLEFQTKLRQLAEQTQKLSTKDPAAS
jgi:hypothetical protein